MTYHIINKNDYGGFEMKIRELRDYLNGLNDDVMDNKVQLEGVYNEFYEEIM